MHACERACLRACQRACVRVCARVWDRVGAPGCIRACLCTCVRADVQMSVRPCMRACAGVCARACMCTGAGARALPRARARAFRTQALSGGLAPLESERFGAAWPLQQDFPLILRVILIRLAAAYALLRPPVYGIVARLPSVRRACNRGSASRADAFAWMGHTPTGQIARTYFWRCSRRSHAVHVALAATTIVRSHQI